MLDNVELTSSFGVFHPKNGLNHQKSSQKITFGMRTPKGTIWHRLFQRI
jgi:hypothetical protein